MQSFRIAILGLWHLGEIYSAGLAELGHQVIGISEDETLIANFKKGEPPLPEPQLRELLSKGLASGRLCYTTDFVEVKNCNVVWLAFDTPVDERDDSDLGPIWGVLEKSTPYLQDGALLVVSSQIPVGTSEKIKELVAQKRPGLKFDYVYTPENLRLGEAMRCFFEPGRIVVGADTDAALKAIGKIFSGLRAKILRMSPASAEMAKHALNAYLATSVSFINDIADLCEKTGADVLDVVRAMKSDPRIGSKAFLNPGLGFAGGTLGRDLKALSAVSKKVGVRSAVVESAYEKNRARGDIVKNRLLEKLKNLQGITVSIFGLTYKVGTKTLRRSRALEIARDLSNEGAVVRLHDPYADKAEVVSTERISFFEDTYEAAAGSSAIVLVTPWPEFKNLDFKKLGSSVKPQAVFFDTSNFLWDKEKEINRAGFRYLGIGRKN